jgi:hypothetical protein
MKSLWTLLVVLLVYSQACARNQQQAPSPNQPQTVFSDPQTAADDALDTLKKMVDESNYQSFGFENAAEVKQAVLGEPAQLFVIQNDKLAKYKPGSNVQPLLEDVHRMIYPVIVNGHGRTLVTIVQNGQEWTLAKYGDQNVAENLARIRNDKIAKAGSGPGSSPSNYYDIRIQTLQIDFLATNQQRRGPSGNNEILLTPLSDTALPIPTRGTETSISGSSNGGSPLHQDTAFMMYLRKNPKFTPEGGSAKPATDVLGALAPAARKIQGTNGPS